MGIIFIKILLIINVIYIVSMPPSFGDSPIAYTPKMRSQAEIISSVSSIKPGEPFWVAFKITMKPGWHTYWQNPGDSGFPTTIKWDLPNGFSAGSLQYPAPERLTYDKFVNFGYKEKAYYLTKVTPAKDIKADKIELKAKLDWALCEASNCTAESVNLSLDLPINNQVHSKPSPHKALIDEIVSSLPKQIDLKGTYKIVPGKLVLTLPKDLYKGDTNVTSLSFFTLDNTFSPPSSPQTLDKNNGRFDISISQPNTTTHATKTPTFSGLIQATDHTGKVISNTLIQFDPNDAVLPTHKNAASKLHFWSVILFALLGGISLNAMPCVFPILSLKALSIARNLSHSHTVVRQHGLFYTGGAILTFLVLANILILVKGAGQSVGWGFQMQNPYFVALIMYLTFFMALSLSGLFHLPILFGTTQASIDTPGRESNWSSFLVGVLAVLVTTPCTAPFMGVAIGYAITQPMHIIWATFFALGFGFSLPYLLISFFPGLFKLFPKPGSWMETFKEFMAFPLYFTVIWLLGVLSQQVGTRGMLISTVGLVLMAFFIWLWEEIKSREIITSRLLHSLAIIVFTGAALSPIFHLRAEESPSDIKIENYSGGKLLELRKQGKPVFVYATAAWCLTCKVNEMSLNSAKTKSSQEHNGVVILEANWTNKNQEVTEFLASHGRDSVPLYVFYPPHKDPLILPQILTPSILENTFQEGLKD